MGEGISTFYHLASDFKQVCFYDPEFVKAAMAFYLASRVQRVTCIVIWMIYSLRGDVSLGVSVEISLKWWN